MEDYTRIETTQPQKEQAPAFEITDADRRKMNNKFYQLWRFIALNLMILKAVDRSKRA